MDLASLKFPATAISSILHRLSGVGIFILLPFVLYILELSLHSRATYDDLQALLALPAAKFALWFFSSALAYHVVAGIRHMILDLGIGEGIASAKRSSIFVIVFSIVIIIFLGIMIWYPM